MLLNAGESQQHGWNDSRRVAVSHETFGIVWLDAGRQGMGLPGDPCRDLS